MSSKNNLVSIKLLVKNCGPYKNFGFEKNLGLKKCVPKMFWSIKTMTPKKLGPKDLVKIGPVTAEILLILTNTARAYFALTNVIMTVASFKHGPKILSLKFGQNRINNSWAIPYVDKCRQDKYCLDKCQIDSWLTSEHLCKILAS